MPAPEPPGRPTPYRQGDLYSCAECHTTVVRYGTRLYEFATGSIHDCFHNLARWLDVVAGDALGGSEDSIELLPRVVDAWLRR